MAFDSLPAQPPPLHPEAAAYAEQATVLAREAASRVRHVMDIPYGDAPRQALDIYLPREDVPGPHPVLMFIHGGRWRAGMKEWNAFMAPVVTEWPAVMVSPSYGLSPDFRFPTQIEDILTALAWVHRNIAEHGGDPERIFISGHSAGGHLSALATVRTDLHAQFGLPANPVKACFPVSGTMNFDFDVVEPGSEEEQIRKILLADDAQAPQASPIRYAAENKVPFFLSYGDRDFPRVMATGKEMVDALRAAGVRVEHMIFPDCGHFDAHLAMAEADAAWYATVKAWMQAA